MDTNPTKPTAQDKIIHRIYFDDMPPYEDKFLHYLDSWKRELPDYQIMQWRGTNLDLSANDWVRRAAREKCPVFISEYFRWQKLQEYGGIYLDADCEVLSGKVLDRILNELWVSDEYDAFVGVEEFHNGFPTAQTVAAKKGSALVNFMVDLYDNALSSPLWHWREERSLIGPQLISLYFREHGRKQYEGMFKYITVPEIESRVKVYPQDWFSPKFGLSGKAINYTENTCVYHLFGNANIENMDYEGRLIRDRPLLFHEYLEFIKKKHSLWFRSRQLLSRVKLKLGSLRGRVWGRLVQIKQTGFGL